VTSNIDLRNSVHYFQHLARLCLGHDVIAPHRISAKFILLGSEYCRWPVLPAITSAASIVYSFGVGEDISFDLALMRRFHCHVHAFDPTPRATKWMGNQPKPTELHFFELGIGAKAGEIMFHPPKLDTHVSYTMSDRMQARGGNPVPCRVLDLASIMLGLGHSRLDILKMDVEGAEYAVIDGLDRQSTLPSQLMLEFHHGMYGCKAKDTKCALIALKRYGYLLYYVSDKWRDFGFVHRDLKANLGPEFS
jgi:FkbM family methyltransferase